MRMITFSLAIIMIMSACTGGNQAASDTTAEVVLDETVEMAQVEADSETFASEGEADPTDAPETEDSEAPAEIPTMAPTNTPEPTTVACTYRTDWEIYRIRSGDTIWELAEATNTSVEAVMQANCQTDHVLTIGQYFRLPFIPESED